MTRVAKFSQGMENCRLPNIKIIKSKWIYSVKNDLNSKVKRCKARLVAAGFN